MKRRLLCLLGALWLLVGCAAKETPPAPANAAVAGTWSGGYAMNDLLGFDTAYTLTETVTYTLNEDGTFTGEAGIADEEIDLFIDRVLEEHGKTCEEMFSADRDTVVAEIQTVANATIEDGTYTVAGDTVTFKASGYTFTATLDGETLFFDEGGHEYRCTKQS